MFDRISRSWALIKASATVLRADRELLVFPLLSGVASVLVALSFAVPLVAVRPDSAWMESHQPLTLVVAFLFYLSQYFIIIFFNSALVGAALMRLSGGDPTVKDGLRIAIGKLPQIFGYAVIAATVGMILRGLQERAGFIGRWIVGLIGVAWTAVTFLVVPVLVSRDVGPLQAVGESSKLMKRSWGENLIGNAGIGVAFFLLSLAVVGGFLGLAWLSVALLQSTLLAAVFVVALVLAILALAMLQSALQGIYSAALYRYAATGEHDAAFPPELIDSAFRSKG